MASICVFCDREAVPVQPVWPGWLIRAVTELQAAPSVGPADTGSEVVDAEQLQSERAKTADCVCETCRDGWVRRLDTGVSEFLPSMIRGESTLLPPARRKILARWAAQMAVVLECVSDAPVRTPRFAANRLRTIGVHPGTQVLLGSHDGQTEVLGYRQDLFRRTVDGEERIASQSSLVIGKLLIQVFADPWRDSAPELVDDSAQQFIPLIGSNDQQIVWPGNREIEHGQGTIMANDDVGTASSAQSVKDPVASVEGGADAADARSGKRTLRRRLAFAVAVLGIVVGFGGLGYGLHERSSASSSNDKLAAAQARVNELTAKLSAAQQQLSASRTQLSASEANVVVLKRSVSTLTSAGPLGTPGYQPLSKVVAIVPTVADGLRQCASAALRTAADAHLFAAGYPRTTTAAVDADSRSVASVCGAATKVADTLEGYVNGP